LEVGDEDQGGLGLEDNVDDGFFGEKIVVVR
jgi:hypothetical protein